MTSTSSGRNQAPIWLEVASALLVPAAAVGFSRVFDTMDPLLPIIGGALLSSAVSVLCRRLGLPLLLTAPISLLVLLVLVVNRYAPDTARLGVIPTGSTFGALNQQLDDLVTNFRELQTPVPPLQPFVGAAMVGAWILAFLTDWGAMRLRLAFEPVLPAALLFVFTAIPPVSAGQHRILSTAVFGAAIALWALAQRIATLYERGVWLANDRRRGPISVAQAGAILALLAVITGTAFGDHLPGAEDEPVYSFADREDSTRLVVSPYVTLYSRLVEQSDVELFTVAANEPAYWRMAGLDNYEENIWKLAGDFSREDGDLPSSTELGGERTTLVQTYDIEALATIWLPAAFAPTKIIDSTTDMTWHTDTSSLTVDGSTENGDGVVYTLESSTGNLDAAALEAAPADVPAAIAERYLTLPALPAVVGDTARQVAGGESTRYGQMMALQNFFRTEFDYEVELGPATDDPIGQFLSERRGFCQQFAGTFALMARELGAPARVATGFTWGDPIGTADDGRTIYRVTGTQTHAWPEVYFSGVGWVAFEPTPGRGIPNASYTNTEPAQASDLQPELAADEPVTTTPEPTPGQPPVTAPQLEDQAPAPAVGSRGYSIPWRFALPLLAVVAYLIGLPLLRRVLRSRRRKASSEPAHQVQVAWAEASESLDSGFELQRRPAETRSEFADRLRDKGSAGAEQMVELADLVTGARYHPTGISTADASRARELAGQVDTATRTRVPTHTRYLRELDPRSLPGLRLHRGDGSTSGIVNGNGAGGGNGSGERSDQDADTPGDGELIEINGG